MQLCLCEYHWSWGLWLSCPSRFEFGAAIFIAWGGSLLDVLGGAMLAASCPRKKQMSKYPTVGSSRSGPPSSTKEYVWDPPRSLPLARDFKSSWGRRSPSASSRNKAEDVRMIVNYTEARSAERVFLDFVFRQAFDDPLIFMHHPQLSLTPPKHSSIVYRQSSHTHYNWISWLNRQTFSGHLLNWSLNGGL